jgi:hypothetical protein
MLHVWGKDKCVPGLWWENLNKVGHSKDIDIDERVRLKVILKRWGSVDYISLAQARDSWWALVNTAMNLQVP